MHTSRFDPVKVNSLHQVFLTDPDTNESLWFYDFETSQWIQAKPINKLPYNLCSYSLVGDPDTKCIVTCQDSYRLIEDLDSAPDVEWLEEQRAWREELVSKLESNSNPELDFIGKSGPIKAQVSRVKSDIVPNVLVISPRKKLGQTYGYYYYESTQLVRYFCETDQKVPIEYKPQSTIQLMVRS